ncbi:hypothetical protein TomTYG75_06750 [Sphingobium sp. TomTYG75]
MSLFTNWRKPKEEMVSKAEHERIVANYAARHEEQERIIRRHREAVIDRNAHANSLQNRLNHALGDLATARAEAEANKADAEKWRAARDRRKQRRAA